MNEPDWIQLETRSKFDRNSTQFAEMVELTVNLLNAIYCVTPEILKEKPRNGAAGG